MVDSLGVPMFGQTPFMDKNSAVYQPSSIAFGNTAPTFGGYGGAAVNNSGDAVGSFGQLLGYDGDTPFYDANISKLGVAQSVPSVDTVVHASAAARLFDAHGSTSTDLHRNPTHVASGAGVALAAVGDVLAFKNTQYARTAPTAAELVNAAWLPAATYTPAQWPDFQPATMCGEIDDEEIDSILGKAKISEYMKYLCNVRSLPIGVRGNVPDTGYQAEGAVLSVSAESNAYTFSEYRVSMPFLSGIYGIFADKMFPDMLIGANNMRIEFKLAQNVKALWTTMDPCRRVPGTMRDFVPFTGSASGKARNVGVISSGITACAPVDAALGCANAMVNVKLNNQNFYVNGNTDVFPHAVQNTSCTQPRLPWEKMWSIHTSVLLPRKDL